MDTNDSSVGAIKGTCQIPFQYIVINTQPSYSRALKDTGPVAQKYEYSSYGGNTTLNILYTICTLAEVADAYT